MFQDELKKFDVRIVERNIQEGLVARSEYQAYLDSLPNAFSNLDHAYHLDFAFVQREPRPVSALTDRETDASSPTNETRLYHSGDDFEDD